MKNNDHVKVLVLFKLNLLFRLNLQSISRTRRMPHILLHAQKTTLKLSFNAETMLLLLQNLPLGN